MSKSQCRKILQYFCGLLFIASNPYLGSLSCKTSRNGDAQVESADSMTQRSSWAGDYPARRNQFAYQNDTNIGLIAPQWMKGIPGKTSLGQLSIPGTHDSMAWHDGSQVSFVKDFIFTQSMPLQVQLNAGIRALDIRCRHIKNSFAIHHGVAYLNKNFGEVLQTVRDFLKKNPSETVVMRVKKEHTEEDVTRSFEDTFLDYRKKFPGLFYDGYQGQSLPTLDQVRGKIFVLMEFRASRWHGVAWYDRQAIDIQDDYDVKSQPEIYGKWESIRKFLDETDSGPISKLFVNFISAAGSVMPYWAASGKSDPRTDAPQLFAGTRDLVRQLHPDFPGRSCTPGICSVDYPGMNRMTLEYIRGHVQGQQKPLKKTGIIMADFPGAELIYGTIQKNFCADQCPE